MGRVSCRRCSKKVLSIREKDLPLDGYCEDCYELVTGKCSGCSGTGLVRRGHLGTMECPKCEGSGLAG